MTYINALKEIKSILKKCSDNDVDEIINDLYKNNYTNSLSTQFDNLLDNDKEVRGLINKLYKMKILEYLLVDDDNYLYSEYDWRGIEEIKGSIYKIDSISLPADIKSIKSSVIYNIIEESGDVVKQHPLHLHSDEFKTFIRSKVLETFIEFISRYDSIYSLVKPYNHEICEHRRKTNILKTWLRK